MSMYMVSRALSNDADVAEAIDRHIPHAKKKYKEAMAELDPVAIDARGRHSAQNSRKSTVRHSQCSLGILTKIAL
jgi:hypothetical protein